MAIDSCTILVPLHVGGGIVQYIFQPWHGLNGSMAFRVKSYYLAYLRSSVLPLGCPLMRSSFSRPEQYHVNVAEAWLQDFL